MEKGGKTHLPKRDQIKAPGDQDVAVNGKARVVNELKLEKHVGLGPPQRRVVDTLTRGVLIHAQILAFVALWHSRQLHKRRLYELDHGVPGANRNLRTRGSNRNNPNQTDCVTETDTATR